jgi:hypothetical protein
MVRRSVLLGAFLAALAFAPALFAPPANAANWLEKNLWLSGPRYDGVLPVCQSQAVLDAVAERFATKEGRFWNSPLQIVAFDQVRETAYRPWANDTIPRRFCRGAAMVSDGIARRVYYSIVEDGGMIGSGWGVEWCVDGLDRNMAYNPHCKMAGP